MLTRRIFFLALLPAVFACANPVRGNIGGPKLPPTKRASRVVSPQGGAPLMRPKPAELEPVVLMHGMAGWATVAGVTYFNGVEKVLKEDGYSVFATEVDPFNSVDERAKQVAKQLDAILLQTGAKKLHLIGHSQGGLDARYVVSRLGYADRVATVTSMGTPHLGTSAVDVAFGNLPGPGQAAITSLFNAFAHDATGREADLKAQLKNLSQAYSRKVFNPATPNAEGVDYYSYTGMTQASPLVDADSVDVAHAALLLPYKIIKSAEGNNDGLVSVESAKWGTFLGVFAADHFDEVGQPPTAGHIAFDHRAFYRKLAKFLQGDGPAPIGTL